MIIGIKPQESGEADGDVRLAQSYQHLQRVVGFIALTLPLFVAVGDALLGDHAVPRGSISAYYYGRTGNYFVGSLCALGVFFVSYEYAPDREHEVDNVQSFFAGLFAVGVALFPTSSGETERFSGEWWVKAAHLSFAGLLFAMLALFSLYHFTKTANEVTNLTWRQKLKRLIRTDPKVWQQLPSQKQKRNRVYRACGWIIVACIALIVASNIGGWEIVFWLESVAVMAFGVSWLIKSAQTPFLRDEKPDLEASRAH